MQLDHTRFSPDAALGSLAPQDRPRARRPRDRTARLVGALNLLGGGQGRLIEHHERPWASITFAGTRHQMTWLFEGIEAVDAGERLIAEAPDHEFALPGQLIAEVAIDEVDHRLDPTRLEVVMTVLVLDEV